MQKAKSNLFKGIFFSYLYILVYFATGMMTTPILLNYFQHDYFALLMLIYAVITYLNNIRLGLPESLATLLAKSKHKSLNIQIAKKSLFMMAVLMCSTILLIFVASFLIDDWRILLGDVYSLDTDKVKSVLYILVLFAIIKIPFDISLSIFIGFHDVYLEKVYKIFNLILNFSLVLFVVHYNESIVFFAWWASLLDLFVSLLSFIHSLKRYNILNEKSDILVKTPSMIELLKKGILFFQFSFIQAVVWGAGIFFVSHMLLLEDVTIYSLSMKIYIYLFYAFFIINSVIAPMYGKYFSVNSWENINKIFSLMLLLFPFFGGLIWIGTLYFMSDVIALWSGSRDYYIGSLFVLFMGGFIYFATYVNSYTTLLYSIGEIKTVLYVRWQELGLNLFLSLVFVYYFGITGIAMGMSISIIFISARIFPKYISSITNGNVQLNFQIQKKHFIFAILPNVFIAFIVTTTIEILVIKLIIFGIIVILYSVLSWAILSLVEKEEISDFFKKLKVFNG